MYRESIPGGSNPWVLFVVDQQERNLADQKNIEAALQFKHGISSIRATFTDIGLEMTVDSNNKLYVRGKEIGLVYFRTGYQINQYDCIGGVDGWKVRAALENSMAIKCPSIDVQLTTFKKY